MSHFFILKVDVLRLKRIKEMFYILSYLSMNPKIVQIGKRIWCQVNNILHVYIIEGKEFKINVIPH